MGLVNEPDALAKETWFNNRWRPAMAWLWFAVSACDFIVFPVLNAIGAGAGFFAYQPWKPLTLQGGGLFHMAMGGVVGVAAWQRTQEKMAIYGAPGLGTPFAAAAERTTDTVTPTTSSRGD
jgi:hypothetical protein